MKTIEYRGLFIDEDVTYPGLVSVQFFGDDLIFNTVEEAKQWIDEAASEPVGDLIDAEDWDDEPYIPSSSRGDYGPGNPWEAPGMSVRDFI